MDSRIAHLEAILFTTTKPLSVEKIAKDIGVTEEVAEQLLQKLEEKYNERKSGIKLATSGGYRLIVKEDYLDKVSHLTPHADLSRGLLRVLSIIFYHEPIKQSEIVKVIGNRTYEYVKELEQRGLIKSEKMGRTKQLETTKYFEEYFGVEKQQLKQQLDKGDIRNEKIDELGDNSPDK